MLRLLAGVFGQPRIMKAWTFSTRLTSIWQTLVLGAVSLLLVGSALLTTEQPAYGIPAFARKYNLPCSACHEAWPKLNNFGQVFRDNGYQLGNGKDSPIWQHPSYFPITFRITPQWHRESSSNQKVDSVPGDATSPPTEKTFTSHGFDLSGVDIWTAGTLFKNISFSVLPSSDSTASFHFENAWVRFDNLLGSRWANLKFGKFELDNMISEKRILFLSTNGGLYQVYHFLPAREAAFVGSGANPLNPGFGLGDNQLGMELAGHSINSYTRYSLALLSSNDGNVGIPNNSYDGFASVSQAFELGGPGLQRVGAFAYFGQRPTNFNTAGGAPITGSGIDNKSFYRAGLNALLYANRFDFSLLYVHGWENAFLGTGTPGNTPLPSGAQAPTWNGGFVETHYTFNPKLIFVQRDEFIRMSRQALVSDPTDFGNRNAYSFGYRWYPIMYSRAGLAWHSEYAIVQSAKTSLVTGHDVWSSSLFFGFDFDF
jgi:hypothetical protein